MTIQGGNIHNILRTYNKQIKYGKLASIDKESSKSKELDKVTLSPEAKKVMFVSSLFSEDIQNKDFSSEDIEKYLNDKGVDFSNISDEELSSLKEEIFENLI
jgi:hypothetical protein